MPGFPRLKPSYDFVVAGAGHAGLQAGLKAGLLMRTACLLDRGRKYSRSYYAPKMDNIPGFPDGISGHALLDLQVEAVRRLESRVGYFTPARVTAIVREGEGYATTFEWLAATHTVRSKAVILALGVVDRMPEIDGKIDGIFPWANQALVDFCLLCDGHELTGRTVAVLGDDAFAARTALDLFDFEVASVEVLTFGRPFLGGVAPAERAALQSALDARGVRAVETPVVGYDGLREKRFGVRFADGTTRTYDRGFSALGWYDLHQEIPRSLGCAFDPDGYVITDDDGRVLSASTHEPIPGLYAAGDLRNGWNQIPEAWATAERAVIHAFSSYLD